MNALNAAVKIYKLRSEEDMNLRMLEILSFTEDVKMNEVIENYRKIASGETKVAFIRLKIEISEKEKSELEKKIRDKFGGDTIFDYEVSPEFSNNMEIRVGDDILAV